MDKMLEKRSVWTAICCGSLLIPGAALAHHSFAAEYSRDLPITVTGIVSKVEWMNPHARFLVKAKDKSGKYVVWNFQLASPNALYRKGWTRHSLKVGDTVSVVGWRARDAAHRGDTKSVKLANGKVVFSLKSIAEASK